MSEEPQIERRLKYYGRSDYGTYYQLDHAYNLLRSFDDNLSNPRLNDIVELHNAIQFVENDFLPPAVGPDERRTLSEKVPSIRRAIGVFFGSINDGNFAQLIGDVHFAYNTDVLSLLARNRVFDRCSATVVLPALRAARIPPGDLFSCSDLIRAYDNETKALLLSSPDNAELLISQELQADGQRGLTLPASFTPSDSRQLIDSYIDSASPNPNYLQLVANARVNRKFGVDARLKLKARRAYDAFWAEHFRSNEGIRTGCEVRVSDDQVAAVEAELDGFVARFSYSRQWLEGNLDKPTILNNFVHVFEFANIHMMLNLPSFYSQLGVMERFMGTPGREDYRTGAAYNLGDQASLLQLVMYDHILQSEGVALESVIEWFFNEYIDSEFGASRFRYRRSSDGATFLEKSRHLFSEMESVLKQFRLFVENGELDLDLLSMTSEQLAYKEIPSLVEGKYVYLTDDPDIQRIQHLLFSDQAGLGYINPELSATTFAELITHREIPRNAFAEYHAGELDFLIGHGVVETSDRRIVRFANAAMFRVLKCLNDFEAASYHHYSRNAQQEIDKMLMSGWVACESTLLTATEASYFNYQLNQSEFNNGPDLRNRYLHGSQVDGEDDRVHRTTYMQALRLLIALVIKINDEFELRDGHAS